MCTIMLCNVKPNFVGVFIVCLIYLAFTRKAVAPEEHLDEETRVAENAQILVAMMCRKIH